MFQIHKKYQETFEEYVNKDFLLQISNRSCSIRSSIIHFHTGKCQETFYKYDILYPNTKLKLKVGRYMFLKLRSMIRMSDPREKPIRKLSV